MKKIKIISFLICLIIFVFSIYKIYEHFSQESKSKNVNKKLIDKAVVVNREQVEDNKIPISIDFDILEKESKNIIGWIYSEDTPINYPIARGKDNVYYLNHLVNDEINNSGSIFLDYRNDVDFSDNEIIIYGHNMKNDTMFGTLTNYKNEEYYKAHKKIYISTKNNNFEMEVLAQSIISENSKLYDLEKKNVRNEIIKIINEKNNDINIVEGDKLIVLSTCTNQTEEERYVLIGKLEDNL